MAKEIISKEEGERLREFREMEGLSQDQMGVVLGRSQQHVGKLENGTRRIQIKDVKILHLVFNMSYEWFYHNEGFRKYRADRKTVLSDLASMETNLNIALSKIDQLDSAVKLLYKDFYLKNPIK